MWRVNVLLALVLFSGCVTTTRKVSVPKKDGNYENVEIPRNRLVVVGVDAECRLFSEDKMPLKLVFYKKGRHMMPENAKYISCIHQYTWSPILPFTFGKVCPFLSGSPHCPQITMGQMLAHYKPLPAD